MTKMSPEDFKKIVQDEFKKQVKPKKKRTGADPALVKALKSMSYRGGR